MTAHNCRFCDAPLKHRFVDLGSTPLANAYLTEEQLKLPEPSYPLRAFVCTECWLVQADAVVPPEDIFSHYAYFSSYSDGWVEHARQFTIMARKRFGLGEASQVIEVASNDGYLLKHFVEAGVPVLGIEPAENIAEVARQIGVPTEARFFGKETAADLVSRGLAADIVIGNNVLAHVPDINDFVGGLSAVLKPDGVVSVEFPHLLRLMENIQFDTVYHEHFYYLSLLAVEKVFAAHGLKVFDVEELPTHGGSLRVLACRATSMVHAIGHGRAKVRTEEAAAGFDRVETYEAFQSRVAPIKDGLLAFLEQAKRSGKKVAAYGAAAKGNTLLNFCGVSTDLIEYVVDRNPHKQGHFLPGSKLPIYAPEKMDETQPDYVLILPWNIKNEVVAANSRIGAWGGRFAVAVPELTVLG
ncbi:SAM-dependent methyltransferase [Rhizobium leguminosarum bv. trifolii WSM1689]|uniref:class I SAM-dependent methyltransferase n=1 Tax=Rhizobium leguminosarum TaxID=384 RepID=UPI0003E08DF8|nr:class I SAM-dependent methyltransferase [Rhizobium leguminosarum]AHF86491.1 SAM-dependent methyltransferase [Rhizobium leguminosarum bv. trifolii WSM1689]MBY5739298.1 class I SAM-dependent methyltransferase [Rhizobium leguminosarum]